MTAIQPHEHISEDEREGRAELQRCPSCEALVPAGILGDIKPCHVCGGGGCHGCLTECCEGCGKRMHSGCVDAELPNEGGEMGSWCQWCSINRERDLDGAGFQF